MGRELRRKEEKKNKNNKQVEKKYNTDMSGKNLLIIFLVVLVILLILYYILAVFVTGEIDVSGGTDTDTSSDAAASVSNKILASNIFRQSEEVYYVYFYDFNDEDENLATAVSYSDLTIYRVDTSSALNSNYVTDEESGNTSASGLDDLKVINPTLIEITNDSITAYYEGVSSIEEFLS